MADDRKATDAAKTLAEEQGVDLAQVQGTGADGQITKHDVEAAVESASASGAGEKLYYGIINPKAGTDRLALTDSDGVEHLLVADPYTGIVQGRVFSDQDLEDLARVKAPPSMQHPSGFKYLLKGREV